jgi:hypothetical protein
MMARSMPVFGIVAEERAVERLAVHVEHVVAEGLRRVLAVEAEEKVESDADHHRQRKAQQLHAGVDGPAIELAAEMHHR